MNIVWSFFVFFVIIFLVKCEDSCRVIPVHKGTVLTADVIPVTDSFGHQIGTQVLYVQADTTSSVDSGSSLYIRCRDPYRFQGNPTLVLGEIICRNGRWIPPPACLRPPCDIRFLNYPGLDKGEEITFFHGESFEPRCLHGYKVAEKADKRIHCENGKWTGNLPPCTKEHQCKLPEKPEFGSVELLGNSATVGSVVIFACDKGRKLIGSVISTCNNASVWTSPTPRCVEPQCELPEKPEFGSVELIGNSATVGSVVVFACDNGRKLIGSVVSICNSASGWTSPSPRCVAQCNTESLLNFEGLAVESGLILSEGEWIQPKCKEGFQTANQDHSKIYCRDGEWEGSMPPCSPLEKEPCRSEPPEPENGKRKSEWWNIEHGASVEYECLPKHVMTETGSVVCSFGKWTGSLPVCKKTRCRTEDLAGFNGLVLEGYRTLDEGDWFRPKCAEGFEFSNKLDSRLYCREGVWQGNLPPCTPAHCSNNPPIIENGRIKSLRAIGHGSSIEYECLMFYELVGKGNVVCSHGQWTGFTPTCKDTRCYLRNLPEKGGLDLTDDSPVGTNRKANIVCMRGYNLRYPEVYCVKGVWSTENLLSPCQENDCEVENIRNGKILKERTVEIKNVFGYVTRTNTVREPADIGSRESTGAALYVECNPQYTFQGQRDTEEQVRITCRRGEWTPLPVCLPPGEPMETDLSVTGEPIGSDNVAILPNSQMNRSAVKESETNISTRVSGQNPFSTNNSLGENIDDARVISDSNITESEELQGTDATVNPLCSCTYTVQSRTLVAHNGNKLVKYGDEIPSGSVIAFYCNSTGYLSLNGRQSVTCPEDCNWDSTLFPSCVIPTDEDVITRVFASPPENMEVGPGGVFFVVPGTRLQLVCRGKTGHRPFVNWTTPSNNGFYDSVIDRDTFRMYYIVLSASSRDSGRYTCFKESGPSRTLEVSVADKECPEIKLTEELAISYTPSNRKSGSRAAFHCFSPYMRNGPSFVTCEASGFWSGPPASCYLPTCSMESLYDIIPEGVVPVIDGEISENVQFGHELSLGCDEVGRSIRGGNTAICGEEGKWRAGDDIHCAQGCAGWRKKNGSTLLISPNKEFYDMGESVTFSCPEGKELTINVQRILCFKSGWTPDTIPDCQ